MIQLVWKVVPYALLGMGLLSVVVGIGTQFEDVPTAPTSIAISSFLRTPTDSLPDWVHVDGGLLYWSESTEVYREHSTTSARDTEHVFVPLVDKELASAWMTGSVRGQAPLPTCVLVRFDRQMLRDQFPDYFDRPAELGKVLQPHSLSFAKQSEPLRLGITSRVLEIFKDYGFREVVIAVPESTPLSKGEAKEIAVVGAVFAALSSVWVSRRRKRTAD